MAELTKTQLDTIKAEQEAHFKEVIVKDKEGADLERKQYKQILKSEGLGYWVDVLQNEKGWGYIIREERIVDGKTEEKATGYGEEAKERTHDWIEVSEEKV